jgi:hypothetical protein
MASFQTPVQRSRKCNLEGSSGSVKVDKWDDNDGYTLKLLLHSSSWRRRASYILHLLNRGFYYMIMVFSTASQSNQRSAS